MAEEKEVLSIEEQESIAAAVLALVKCYREFPKTVTEKQIHIDELKSEVCMGIFPTAGAVVTKRYLSGNFEAQFPFDICYKCNPTTDSAVLDARRVLEGLAKWLESTTYPRLSDGTEIQKVSRVTTAILAGKTKDGAAVFKCSCTLKYFKKRR